MCRVHHGASPEPEQPVPFLYLVKMTWCLRTVWLTKDSPCSWSVIRDSVTALGVDLSQGKVLWCGSTLSSVYLKASVPWNGERRKRNMVVPSW